MTDDGAGGVIASRGQDVRNTHIQMTSCLPPLSREERRRSGARPFHKTRRNCCSYTVTR